MPSPRKTPPFTHSKIPLSRLRPAALVAIASLVTGQAAVGANTYTVTNPVNDGSNAPGSLGWAINQALAGDEVVIASGITHIQITGALPPITRLLSIGAANPVSLDGNLTGNDGSLFLMRPSSGTGRIRLTTDGSYHSDGYTINGTDYDLVNNGSISSSLSPNSPGALRGVSGNNYFLINNGTITVTSGVARNIVGVNGNAYALTNNGTISASGPSAVAVQSYGHATIRNAGTISASGDDAQAISFKQGPNVLIIEPRSVINGIVWNSDRGDPATLALGGNAGSDIFDLGSIGARGSSAKYQGFTDFVKQENSTWTLTNSGAANWSVTGGTLRLADGMALTGGIANSATVSSGNATISGAFTNSSGGSLTVAAGKTFRVGDFVNQGRYQTSIAGMDSYGKLVVNGTATLGGTLFVDAANAAGMSNGNLTGIITANTLTGTFSSYSTNSLLFSYTPVYAGNQVNLVVTALSTPVPTPPVTPGSPASPNPTPGPMPGPDAGSAPRRGKVLSIVNAHGNRHAIGAAAALDAIFQLAPNGEVARHFQKFIVGQEAQLSQAVSQTLPVLTGRSQVATTSTMAGIARIIQTRVETQRGLSSGDEFIGDKNLWVKPFGSWANQKEKDGVSGHTSRTYGITVGIDRDFSDKTLLGLAFGYANSSLNGSSGNAPQQSTTNLYQLIAYGSYRLDAATQLHFQLDAGTNDNEGQRTLAFQSLVANASYKSRTAHGGIGISHSVAPSDKTMITPGIRADYVWIRDNAYSETGAGALNLNVNKRSSDQLTLTTDIKLAHSLGNGFTLSLNGGAGYDMFKRQSAITAAFAGAPGMFFVTEDISPDPWTGHAGAGVSYSPANGVDLNLRYDIEARSNFTNQTASVKARWRF